MCYDVSCEGMEEDECLSSNGSEPKSPSAVDFYDINELCEETEDATNENVTNNNTSENSIPFHNISNMVQGLLETNETMIIPDKPLASVLPTKYQDVDVKALFPNFSDNDVLRFLRLFGPGKKSNMPDIWRSVRKRISERKASAVITGNPESYSKPLKDCEPEINEEIKFLKQTEGTLSTSSDGSLMCNKPLNNSWRFGAAKLWYDMAEVPEHAETYDYGFKVVDDQSTDVMPVNNDIDDESYLMVTQYEWENDIIWDGDDVKDDVMKKVYDKNKAAGWIPVSADRTVASYQDKVKNLSSQNEVLKVPQNINRSIMRHSNGIGKEGTQSLFPEENLKLLYDRWEDDVIFDSEAMPRISYPKPVEYDSDIIMKIPDDKPPSPDCSEPVKDRKDRKFRAVPKKLEEDEENSNPVSCKTDFYNISNDEYYNPKMTQENALKLNYGGSLLQHSIPALELQPPFFPTFMGPIKLKRFHRPTLKQYSHGPLSKINFHGVKSLTRRIKQKECQRQKELKESGGGEMFFMRTTDDLSGKDGDLVFFEFSEENPPLMKQVGMASRIRNYYRRRPGKETSMPDYKYGEIAYAHTSPFLGTLQPGQSVQAYENHLFRSPIYEHSMRPTDFLIIRTRFKYFIREVSTVYTVGQELPLIEVPAPKSEKANNFLRDFLMVFIYRLFWKSDDSPRKIKMELIKKAFPQLKEFTIRKRLNLCADFQRTGFDSKFWVLKNSFRLPSEDEIRLLVSPEQCCAYYSMRAAEERLKDAGYGDKNLPMAEDENDTLPNRIEDEVKAAPWNTTQAFISAIRGKSLLDLTGKADPSGCGEGFSYIKIPNKPQLSKDENNAQNPSKRLVKGTDADLRRLSLTSAKKLLKGFNVSDRELKNMTRWQVIHMVRTISTEQAKMGDEGITKYARGNLFSQAEHLRSYKEECQRLFDLQNRVLASDEVLSTDEESSSEEDSDLEEMGKAIENKAFNKESRDFLHEREEAERKELKKLMTSDVPIEENKKNKLEKFGTNACEGKILKIYRTYKNDDGSEFSRVETVRKPEVIQLYMKIRESNDKDFIKNFSLDEEEKEKLRRKRRCIQDQLRRINRNELKGSNKEPPKRKTKIETPQMFKVKCGACGATGHMRTNRTCPLYQSSPSLPPIQVAMTEEQEEAAEKAALGDQNLIKIDETKIIVSKQLFKHADEIRRKSLVLKFPKEAVASANKKNKRTYDETFSDYMSTPKGIHRKRVDPVVSISVIFEKLINELKSLPNTQPFWLPVNVKEAPSYYDIIKKPMDLQTMKDKSRQQLYKSREDFIKDLQQILDNSSLYNGDQSFFSLTANSMLEHCFKRFSVEEEKLMELEKAINPLLDNDQVAFSFMLETIVSDELKSVPESWPFHKPVEKRLAKGYYNLVKNPMDLDSVIKNCKSHKYKTRSAFLSDVILIHSNSVIFNGADSQFTKVAQNIVNACHASLDLYAEQLEKLELGIKELELLNPTNNNHSSTPRIKLVVKPLVRLKPNASSNCNGSTDFDSFVDVESMETSVKNSSAIDSICFDKNIANSENFLKSENESNSSFMLPDLCYDLEPSSVTASPSVPTQTESLLNLNGITQTGYSSTHPEELAQPYSQITCDTICDDLKLSESDSEDDMQTFDALKF